MLISLHCAAEHLLFDVADFADLFHQAQDAFGSLIGSGLVLQLRYRFQGFDVMVQCQKGFDTFLKLVADPAVAASCGLKTDAGVPALRVAQGKPLALPIADADADADGAAAPGVAAPLSFGSDVAVPNASHRKSAPGPRKSAPPPTTDPQPPQQPTPPPAEIYYPEQARAFTRPQSAKLLLDSFAPISHDERPRVRAIMRDGSFSALVDFDPFNPPFIVDLYKRVQDAFGPVYDRDHVAANAEMQLSVSNPKSPATEFDIEDKKDIAMLAQMLREGGEYATYIIVEFFDPAKAADADEYGGVVDSAGSSPSRYSQILSNTGPSPTRRREPLGYNLAHTPHRSRATTPVIEALLIDECYECMEHVESGNKCVGKDCGAFLHEKCAKEGNLCSACWRDSKRT